MYDTSFFAETISRFQVDGELISFLQLGNGHINDTYELLMKDRDGKTFKLVLQRINTEVFKNPFELMKNVIGITDFLRKRIRIRGGNPDTETLRFLETKDRNSFYITPGSEFFRAYYFIDNVVTLQQIRKLNDFYHCGKSFGRFMSDLSEYPADTLFDTIPNFHNTVSRFKDFTEAVSGDKAGRLGGVRNEVAFAMEREDIADIIVNLLDSRELPLRVTHNDTKLNNVLMHEKTGQGICVIDLDTVMRGSCLYDFGDSIRFGASAAAEDETDLSLVGLDLEKFEAYTKGYFESAGGALTDREIDMLPDGAMLMTLECGVRFLGDYLNGDIYFKIQRPEHNLERARTQFKLLADMEQKRGDMKDIIRKISGR